MSDDGVLFGFLTVLICIGVIVGFILGIKNGERIKSDQPITPMLSIQIENGVADTTYIYKLK